MGNYTWLFYPVLFIVLVTLYFSVLDVKRDIDGALGILGKCEAEIITEYIVDYDCEDTSTTTPEVVELGQDVDNSTYEQDQIIKLQQDNIWCFSEKKKLEASLKTANEVIVEMEGKLSDEFDARIKCNVSLNEILNTMNCVPI